jgi:hypothetical protein
MRRPGISRPSMSRCPAWLAGVENPLDLYLLQHGIQLWRRGLTEGRIKRLDRLGLGRSRTRAAEISHPPQPRRSTTKTLEAGLLTNGSSYSPTPSQWIIHQWLPQLAFVPDHSGASVRELHPLPACSASIATIETGSRKNISPEPGDVKAILLEGLPRQNLQKLFSRSPSLSQPGGVYLP